MAVRGGQGVSAHGVSWGALRLTVVFFGGVIVWTLFFLPFGFLAWCWLAPVRGGHPRLVLCNIIHFYGVRCCRLLAGQTRITIENRAGKLPRPCIVVGNHQSFFDAYCIGYFPVFAPTYVVRAWPFRIPLYGWIMRRAGYVNIEELEPESLLRAAGEVIREGATLVVFPEGTRSSTGELGRFHAGAFRLAMEYDVPIVPLCIDGAGKVFPRGTRFGRPEPFSVTLLPPVYPASFREHGELAHRRLQQGVKKALRDHLRN